MDAASSYKGWIFKGALGDPRSIVGTHIAMLATRHGPDMEGDLSAKMNGRTI
jgi:hypothetical protein